MKSQTTNINDSNIELYILQLKEGTLTDAERKDVERALGENKDWQQLADMYDPSLLLPGYPHLIFSDKEKLRAIAKPATKRKFIVPIWSRVAAACAIITVAIIFFRIGIGSKPDNDKLAFISTEKTIDTTNNSVPINTEVTPIHKNDAISAPSITNKNESLEAESIVAENQEESSFDLPEYLYTDNLITFVDDDLSDDYIPDNELKTDKNQATADSSSYRIYVTDKLITYYDDPLPLNNNTPYAPKPQWQSTVGDWISNIQLARLELHTGAVNNLRKLMKSNN